MQSIFEKEFVVAPSMSDGKGHLSIHGVFSAFMDVAMEHAMKLGIGLDYTMPRGLFWITVRTKVKFLRHVNLSEILTLRTWPEVPSKLRCVRYYALSDKNGICVEGKTEWAIINMQSGRPQVLEDVYPDGMEFCADTVCDTPFMRISDDFSDGTAFKPFRVESSDIDMGRHMNNVMYVRHALNCFSVEEFYDMNIHEFEVCYRTACFEKETITPHLRKTEDGYDMGFVKEDGKCAVLIHMK